MTKLGVLSFLGAAAMFVAIYGVHCMQTSSFARGRGFALWWLGRPMLGALGLGLLLLLIGGIVDSARYTRARKRA